MSHGTLYLIPNTLGPVDPDNVTPLSGIIPEAVLSLTASLPCFIAENAKTTRAFLKIVHKTHPLERPLQEIQISELNVNTTEQELPGLLTPLLEGKDAGLISEAGVPAVADPGANLVRLAHAHGIMIRPLVGPSSILLAIMASGLNGQSFAFNGYLPTDAGERIKRIRKLEERSRTDKQTQAFIETPYRNGALFDAFLTACQPGTMLSVATDVSLPSESIHTQSIADWKSAVQKGKQPDFHKKPTVFSMLA